MHSSEFKPFIIAVMVSTPNCGVTHFCIELAIFISKVRKKRCAIIEVTQKPCLGFLISNKGRSFKNITIYRNSNHSTINQAVSLGYDYIIIDIGTNICNYKSEYTMSDMRIIIMNLSKHWLSRTFKACCEMSLFTSSSTRILYVFGSPYEAKTVEKILKKHLFNIPFEKELFRISSTHLKFYDSLLK